MNTSDSYMMTDFFASPVAEGQVEARIYALLRAADEVGTQEAWNEAVATAHELWVAGGFDIRRFGTLFPHAVHYLNAIMEYDPQADARRYPPQSWVVSTGLAMRRAMLYGLRTKVLWFGVGFGIGLVLGGINR